MNQEIELFLVALIVVPTLIFFIYEARVKEIVLKNSNKIKSLQNLNKQTLFYEDINKEYLLQTYLNSKQRLETADFDDQFMELISQNEPMIVDLINKVDANNKLYQSYIKKVNSFSSDLTKELSAKFYIRFQKMIEKEKMLFDKIQKRPVLDLVLVVMLRYVSPAGRNSYKRRNVYNFFELKNFYQEYLADKAAKQTRAYKMQLERSKMSASLRYKVLIRDKKICVICGASAKNGAVLHVDHIIPVAKGGLTTLENLRTLCDRCNLGKKDKIESEYQS